MNKQSRLKNARAALGDRAEAIIEAAEDAADKAGRTLTYTDRIEALEAALGTTLSGRLRITDLERYQLAEARVAQLEGELGKRPAKAVVPLPAAKAPPTVVVTPQKPVAPFVAHPALEREKASLLETWIGLQSSDPDASYDFYLRHRVEINQARRDNICLKSGAQFSTMEIFRGDFNTLLSPTMRGKFIRHGGRVVDAKVPMPPGYTTVTMSRADFAKLSPTQQSSFSLNQGKIV